MVGKFVSIIGLGAAIALLFTIQSSTPQSAGPGGILTVFFLLYVVLTACFTFLVQVGNVGLRYASSNLSLKRPVEKISTLHALYYASVIGFAPILLIGMRSVGKAGPTEWILVGLFVAIGVFYLRKRL